MRLGRLASAALLVPLLGLTGWAQFAATLQPQRPPNFLNQSYSNASSFQSSQHGVQSFSGDSGTPKFILDRNGVPEWEVDREFPTDVFTFARVFYNPQSGPNGTWRTDWPDSDLNFSFRLQQLTALKVNPHPAIVELSDPKLFNYPFVYFCEPGKRGWSGLNFTPHEAESFRLYLKRGGFAMFDDFWGEDEWHNFKEGMRAVFPDREPVELTLDHPIFSIVYNLTEKPQVPALGAYQATGLSYERYDAAEPHYWAYYDDNQRIVAIACHNTDLGDGWEREGEDKDYFHKFSEKQAYPMGINILVYAMTH